MGLMGLFLVERIWWVLGMIRFNLGLGVLVVYFFSCPVSVTIRCTLVLYLHVESIYIKTSVSESIHFHLCPYRLFQFDVRCNETLKYRNYSEFFSMYCVSCGI